MHRFKGKVFMLGALAALVAAFVVLLGSMGDSSTVTATNPTPTPKITNDGNLGGVYDLVVSVPDAETVAQCVPGNILDEDTDGTVNDGCAAVGPAETLAQCVPGNVADEDTDGTVNDGCAAVGPSLDSAPALYHCIAKLDHQTAGDLIQAWVVCYAEVELGDGEGEPPGVPNDLIANTPTSFVTLEPQKAVGTFAGGKLNFTVCFSNLGGGSAPNIMATVNVPGIKAQLAGGPPHSNTGVAAGTVVIYSNMSDTSCAANSVAGATGSAPLPVNLYQVAAGKPPIAGTGCPDSPLVNRPTRCLDYDLDTCSDADELQPFSKTCGDDPYNPFDSSVADLNGSYSILATAPVAGAFRPICPGEPATVQCPWDGTDNPVAGITFHCIAVVKDPGGAATRNVAEDLYCYIDSLASAINPEAYPGCVGDGFPGASPPGKVRANFEGGAPAYTCGGVVTWGDVSTIKHTQLSGALTPKTLTTTGCFEDDDLQSSLGNVIVNATQDPSGGDGTVDIWVNQTAAACAAGVGASSRENVTQCAPGNVLDEDIDGTVNDGCAAVGPAEAGAACAPGNVADEDTDGTVNDGCAAVGPAGPSFDNALLDTARQSNDLLRDTDGDGCSDAEELAKTNDAALGGLRDPYNRWDFYDVDGDKVIGLFGDIFPVAFDFGTAGSDLTDRAAPIAGANVWNLPGPDGLVTLFDDIFGVAFQFGHDCSA